MRDMMRAMMTGAAVSALLTGAAAAQTVTTQDNLVLDPVIIESGEAAASEGVGGTVTTSTTLRATIDNKLIDSIEDLGRTEEAGISFNRTTRSINIRGLEGPRVLTTIDGIRVPYLADATRGANGGADSFDFSSLSALDLTRGADPLLGSGALGGVLALRTLDPEDLLPGDRTLGGLTKNGYDSVDESWFTSNAAAIRVENTYALIQGGYRGGHEIDNRGEIDSLGATRTEPNPLDYDQYNILAKLHQYVEGGHRFGVTGEIFSRDDDIDTRTSQGATGNYLAGNYSSGEDVKRERAALTYDYLSPDWGASWLDEASAVLYYQNVERHSTIDAYRSASVVGPYYRDNSLAEESFGFNGHATENFETGIVSHQLTFGTELRTATTTQYSYGEDNCRRPYTGPFTACNNLHSNQADTPEVDSNSVGFYAEDEMGLYDGRLRLTPGLRFDWYEETPQLTDEYAGSAAYDGTLPPDSSDTAVSPKILVEYDLLPELTAYAQWSMGFRAPTVGELYSRFGAVGTYLRAGNPELEAERSNGFDIGMKYETADYGAHVNVFRTEYENFIDVVQLAPSCFVEPANCNPLYPQGGISSYRNIPDARISGVELGGHVRFLDYWTARGSLAYAEGRNLTDDTYLDSVPPLTAILGLGYARLEWGGEVSTKLAARRDKVDEGYEAPGYGVVDLTAWYAPEALPGFKVAGGIFNVFDKTYYDAVNVPDSPSQPDLYYSEPGRSFKVNVTYQF
ncbi:TonB-dependent hemoglobin/transferrin/lactoferrin family receptor [Aurantimonas sp. HBX-1]|uniref:TonB-dependent hemoglobin/transferrin/lactoferrin family receptor n=1 Tax=Aurantimonas sp. HBX-1 TaxID=2906072 RepID=UPI001F488FCC|nr:TonB-dependent hemoglobin/transferrin/lactoferrin family receptor [Aurantimonas sp. HBX-1]UIJ72611.1 TonB-dependent hemoglobin/transferrin/lactoferrin family receptor [Aurantimonas sp. HBX-1]